MLPDTLYQNVDPTLANDVLTKVSQGADPGTFTNLEKQALGKIPLSVINAARNKGTAPKQSSTDQIANIGKFPPQNIDQIANIGKFPAGPQNRSYLPKQIPSTTVATDQSINPQRGAGIAGGTGQNVGGLSTAIEPSTGNTKVDQALNVIKQEKDGVSLSDILDILGKGFAGYAGKDYQTLREKQINMKLQANYQQQLSDIDLQNKLATMSEDTKNKLFYAIQTKDIPTQQAIATQAGLQAMDIQKIDEALKVGYLTNNGMVNYVNKGFNTVTTVTGAGK
jgi:hypothetical protein